MSYIAREDGERFIIPSYRDTLSAKKPALLKKEVLLLSANYGEYITLQRKNISQYEAAFSPEPGYLLGETVWHYFKRPVDLIYCEAIPNTTEAILVIVKGGSVYLDGSFPIESIPDELVIFRTQQNSFEIYTYGDVPISEHPEEGKFTLDASSVKSFNFLSEPVFPTLPTIKAFQLRLVDAVLKDQGIGVFPVKKVVALFAGFVLIWLVVSYFSTHQKALPIAIVGVVNPYQLYIDTLVAPDPAQEVSAVTNKIRQLYTIPGWIPSEVSYSAGHVMSSVVSLGARTAVLYQWAPKNGASLQILPSGIFVSLPTTAKIRNAPTTISPLQQVIAEIIDRMSYIIPGNVISLSTTLDRGRFSEALLTINLSGLTLDTLDLVALQFRNLPIVLSRMNLKIDNGHLSGVIIVKALGS